MMAQTVANEKLREYRDQLQHEIRRRKVVLQARDRELDMKRAREADEEAHGSLQSVRRQRESLK